MRDYSQRISIDPARRGGRPCIKGTRISVYDVAGWFASGMSESEILEDFPQLTTEDIRAAMAFVSDRDGRITVSNSVAA